jgi:DNA processing protein
VFDHQRGEFAADELLGPFNDFEKRNAPQRVWAAGHVELLRERSRVAVVGSRRASIEGRNRATKLARQLVQADIVVVSGLAEGVDTAAHLGAIQAGGHTIAVLGTPLERAFPSSNEALQRRLATEHLVLTQFAPGATVHPRNFPMRNRLMALVSDATVIVEAQDGSGTIHQGWEAIRLGRPLFLMHSLVASSRSKWLLDFLDHGAIELVATEQIVELLPPKRLSTLEDAPF